MNAGAGTTILYKWLGNAARIVEVSAMLPVAKTVVVSFATNPFSSVSNSVDGSIASFVDVSSGILSDTGSVHALRNLGVPLNSGQTIYVQGDGAFSVCLVIEVSSERS